jgi:bifunctional DNA-binding transcriptional regulator/antitoxin component of YhaV-PrlF toxin-antitoxin module
MTRSTITVRWRTTVPKEVREKLGVGPSDSLDWEIVGDHVEVSASGGRGDPHGGGTQARKIPPGAGAFDSGYSDTADRTDEVLRESSVTPDILNLRGKFKVGPGSTVKDLRKAREVMGTEEV